MSARDPKFIALCEMHGGEFKAADGTLASFKDDFPPLNLKAKYINQLYALLSAVY